MTLPHIVQFIRDGSALDDLKATAGKLWLAEGGEDEDGALARAIDAYWSAKPGADPYWDFLGTRGTCGTCGEVNKTENLAICPNCYATRCYRHDRSCACGHRALG